MKLHIFNPSHDIALATNVRQFTPPHAGRQMFADLAFLPSLWANDGDMVLVNDVKAAIEAVRHLKCKKSDVLFIEPDDLKSTQIPSTMCVEPWGWNISIRHKLLSLNKSFATIMPTEHSLMTIRDMSNRKWAAENLLPALIKIDKNALVGKSRYVSSVEEMHSVIADNGDYVAKAPWSSSGRGIRYLLNGHSATTSEHFEGWATNVINRQGGLMIEPYYNKVEDLAMEFIAKDGQISYIGLSLFKTINGAYAGNILATEQEKRKMLTQMIPENILDKVSQGIIATLQPLMKGKYEGAFGVDMMIVAVGNELKLHPCVELNLRRTMGHIALAISPQTSEPQRLMRIDYDSKYHLRIINTFENVPPTALV